MELTTQNFKGIPLRVGIDTADKLWFLANDVCEALGYANSRKAIADHCKVGGVTKRDIPSQSGIQAYTLIDEPNLYRLIMKSKKEEAESFQDWVTEEVIPTIRKTGSYSVSAKEPSRRDLAQMVLQAEDDKERAEMLLSLANATILIQAPKVKYANEVLLSESNHTTTTIAKEIGLSAITLNAILKEKGIQYKHQGHWVLTYKYQAKGYTKTKTYPHLDSEGKTKTEIQTVWTELGREFIHKVMNKNLVPVPTAQEKEDDRNHAHDYLETWIGKEDPNLL